MKTRIFLVAALVALGFAACNNDDVPHIEDGAKATVSLMIFTDPAAVRSTSEGTNAEREIKSLEVWLFAGEAVVGHRRFEGNELVPDNGVIIAEGIVTTSGARTMVAVANHSLIGKDLTRTELRNTPALAKPDVYSNLVMTSEAVTIDLKPGANFFGELAHLPGGANHVNAGANPSNARALQLVRIHARIALTGVSFEHPNFSRFDLYTVTMFNMRRESRLFDVNFGIRPTTPAASLIHATLSFLRGANYLSPLHSYQDKDIAINRWEELSFNGGNTTRIMPVNSAIPIAPPAPIFFYAFENNGDSRLGNPDWEKENSGTFIVLKGKLYNQDGTPSTGHHTCKDGFTYYAIWVNCARFSGSAGAESNRITRNTMYNITVNIRGVGNPNINGPQAAHLDVQVEVRPWDVVNQVYDWK